MCGKAAADKCGRPQLLSGRSATAHLAEALDLGVALACGTRCVVCVCGGGGSGARVRAHSNERLLRWAATRRRPLHIVVRACVHGCGSMDSAGSECMQHTKHGPGGSAGGSGMTPRQRTLGVKVGAALAAAHGQRGQRVLKHLRQGREGGGAWRLQAEAGRRRRHARGCHDRRRRRQSIPQLRHDPRPPAAAPESPARSPEI